MSVIVVQFVRVNWRRSVLIKVCILICACELCAMAEKSENEKKAETISLLFQKPNEPLFTAKDNGKTIFELPPDFYTERYKSIGVSTSVRLGEDAERVIPLRTIPYPNLDFTRPIQIRGTFSLFNRSHQQIAGRLIEIFINTPEQDLISTAAYVKDRINPYLFLVSDNCRNKLAMFVKCFCVML